ncbi:hypothetical protein [Candidatus Magnetominusculus dajiuhuensis]|uniref:hypothetical protein n=1 Tax=Candidatus Magnetominusculus dajiuhuensis TaxID=3137712 RepID=UPI003B43913F
MSLYSRLVVLLVVSSVVLSPVAGFEEELKSKFYTMSLKESYLKKKCKVRAFFLDSDREFYSVPKIPKGWHYTFNGERSVGLIAAAYTDKEAVNIEYFKDFLIFVISEGRPEKEIYFEMTLIYYKPDGSPEIIVLQTDDFIIKEIHKDLKEY